MDFVRNLMPSNSFSEMVGVLKKFVSFMNITVSDKHTYVAVTSRKRTLV